MTLEEAIKHAEDVAMRGDSECNKQHKQLHEWLSELKYFRDALNSGELKWTVPSPLSVDEDFFIPVRSGKSDILFDPEENAKDMEYFQKSLMRMLKGPTSKDFYVKEKCTHCSGEGWRDGWPCRLKCTQCDGVGTYEVKKTVHYVDVGDLEPEAALEYITQCREALKSNSEK